MAVRLPVGQAILPVLQLTHSAMAVCGSLRTTLCSRVCARRTVSAIAPLQRPKRVNLAMCATRSYCSFNVPQFVLVLAAALISAGQTHAQIDSCFTRTLPVNVANENGITVQGLTAENFEGSLHHKPTKIISVTPDLPRRALIFLDASGSMTSDSRQWQLSVSVASNLVVSMPAGTAVGLFVFSSKIDRNILFTQDRNVLQIELKNLRSGAKAMVKDPHRTALWDTIATGISEFGGSLDGDSIYLISDGDDNASRLKANELKNMLVAKAIRVFAFSPNLRGGPTPEAQAGWWNLITLAEATAGTVLTAVRNGVGDPLPIADEAGVPTVQGELLLMQFRQFFTFYRVEIEISEHNSNVSGLNLKLKGLNPHKLVVTYPHQLASCAAVMPSLKVAP